MRVIAMPEPMTIEITAPDGLVTEIPEVTGFKVELSVRHCDFLTVTTEHGWERPDQLHFAPIGSRLARQQSDTGSQSSSGGEGQ
jgi:hypothetical protein